MRITIDRSGGAILVELAEGEVAVETRALAEGIAANYDSSGRLLSVTILEDATRTEHVPAPMAAVTSAALTPSATPARPAPVPRPRTAEEIAALGPLTWDADAEAAMTLVPFFRRGPLRRAVVARTRDRGLSQVTAAIVEETRAGAR